MQYLSESIATRSGLDGILNVRDIDLVARSLLAVYLEIDVGLAEGAEDSQILDSFNWRMTSTI